MNNDPSNPDHLKIFRAGLISRFGEPVYKSWMSDIVLEKTSDDEVELSTESPLRRETLIQRYKPGMHAEWNRLVSPAKKLSISLREKERLNRHAKSIKENESNSTGNQDSFGLHKNQFSGKHQNKNSVGLENLTSDLDARSTFQAFAVDDTNRIAHAAARQVFVENTQHNLIYIHGPSGVGKTHLLHAIGHEWCNKFGDSACAYITHSGLTNGCVDAVWSNSVLHLHKNLLTHKILLIDDIHLLGGKNRTQQEVLNMVNAFISSGRKLVIAGEASPSRLKECDIHGRLSDRLAGGLSVSLEPGGENLRRDVLKMRATTVANACTINDDAIEFIALNFPHSMREAIGALNQLLLVFGDSELAVGATEAESALRSRLTSFKRPGSMEDGVISAAEVFGITMADIKGRSQPQRIAKARHAFVFVARETLKESFPRIAAVLGRDHTTAMSSYRRAQALLERNQDFRDAVQRISRAVGG